MTKLVERNPVIENKLANSIMIALKQYAKRKDKNLGLLMKYAAMFHVEKILRPYLEVLL